MNFYKHHLGDYAAATSHLSWDEDCAYRRLLDQYYKREAPIPADHNAACRWIRATSATQRKAVQSVLREFFTLEDDGWHQKRCDEEIAQANEQADTNRRIAAVREAKRRERIEHESLTNRSTNRSPDTSVEREPSQTPLARHQTPDTINSVPNGTGGKPPKLTDPKDIIFGYGLSLLVNAGTIEKTARSFLGGRASEYGDQALVDVLRDCAKAKPLQPLEWIAAAMPPKGKSKANAQEALEASNRAVAARFLEKDHAAQ